MKLKLRKIVSVALAVFILFTPLLNALADTTSGNTESETQLADEIVKEELTGATYQEYQKKYEDMSFGNDKIIIPANEYTKYSGIVEKIDDLGEKKGNADVVFTGEDSRISWELNVTESGMYNINVDYYPAPGNGNDIERNLYIDNKIPYNEAKFLIFTRVWADVEALKQDSNGNDIRPKQVETPMYRKTYLYDASRHYNEPLKFYLEKGTHVIELEAVREPMILKQLLVQKAEEPITYEQVKEIYAQKGYKSVTAEPIKIQAENAYQKSDYTLCAATDRSSAITEPQDAAKVKMNSISGGKYKLPGQWITWKIDVPEDGLYNIASRYKQNLLSGLYTSRLLRIDGEIPFKEAMEIKFNYSDNWQVEALGDGDEAFEFYLTKGEHEITLEVTLGDLAPTITEVNDSLFALNSIYRNILMITGPEPDQYRDYSFERQIPQVIELMGEQAKILEGLSEQMEQLVHGKGEQMVILDKVSFQLERMNEDPDKIASTFNSFKDNIAALATWILTVSEQPLSLDYLYITPLESKLPKGEGSFFDALSFEIESFYMSFFVDYNSLGLSVDKSEEENQKIEVWITSGRDQVAILREMINDSFTPNSNISVDLKLVSAGTLLPSVLAGVGPDVSLGNLIGDPIQYAIRNAIISLNDFPEYEEVAKRFHPSAMVSYEFEDKVYALPETQSFPIMFYRKDILAELGLSVPKTWEEFYDLIPEIQKNNMEIGFPAGLSGMQIFLYQNGGSLYNKELSRSTLDEDLTIDAFQQLCELFTTYRFPRDYDFANRFRTGQMPIGIQDYTIYNNLVAFAPEIKGLWGFAPIPGTVQEDGTINRGAPSTGTCAVMMEGAQNPDAAWEFMEWWTRAESQSRFAEEMEMILGKAAKYATANMEAMSKMPWTKSEYSTLMEQWNQLVGTPEIPGGYYVSRSIDFATATAYTSGDGEVLFDYAKDTNDEITRKRKEFNVK